MRITWFWFIPTPGGRLVMLIMFINLASFLFLPILWTKKKVGILIVHFGAVLLLLGGGLTAWFSFEGNMILEEGYKHGLNSDTIIRNDILDLVKGIDIYILNKM